MKANPFSLDMSAATEGGRAWRLPADVSTDALAPGKVMSASPDAMAAVCLETVRADFAGGVRAGDFIVAGPHFGIGSSREQAAAILKHCGIRAVLAPSFAGLFYRNAINLGLPVLICPLAESIPDMTRLIIGREPGRVVAADSDATWPYEPLPAFLQDMLDAGGLLAQLRQRLRTGTLQSLPDPRAQRPT